MKRIAESRASEFVLRAPWSGKSEAINTRAFESPATVEQNDWGSGWRLVRAPNAVASNAIAAAAATRITPRFTRQVSRLVGRCSMPVQSIVPQMNPSPTATALGVPPSGGDRLILLPEASNSTRLPFAGV